MALTWRPSVTWRPAATWRGALVTVDPGTLAAIANAVWAHPQALTLAKFLALKDG